MKRNAAILAGAGLLIALLLASAVLSYRNRQAQIASRPMRMELAPQGAQPTAPEAGGEANADEGMPNFRGKQAPDFQLKTLDGRDVRLSELRGKAVLVNFWATWCAPCKVEIPWFIKLNQQYGPQGLVILGVTAEDIPRDEVEKSAKSLNINYPVLLRGDTIGKDWGGLDGLPTSFYIDRSGKIVDQTIGLYSRDEVEAKIKTILGPDAGKTNQVAASTGKL